MQSVVKNIILLYIILIATLCFFGCQKNKDCYQKETLESNKLENKLIQPQFNNKIQTVKISKGKYIPLFGRDSNIISVNDFEMDIYPVSIEQYRQFVLSNPQWQKSIVKKIFADNTYLNDWLNDSQPNTSKNKNAAITNVSWFAAKEFCECQGKRLPTVDEWEYVAMANEKLKDARKTKEYNQYILSWYEKPNTYLNEVGSTFKNYWGVYDMHGLVWEWNSDFNTILISGESRGGEGAESDMFCGGGSFNANDLMNYAAFMRYAFRGSLKANYSSKNLGFRCVKNLIK